MLFSFVFVVKTLREHVHFDEQRHCASHRLCVCVTNFYFFILKQMNVFINFVH